MTPKSLPAKADEVRRAGMIDGLKMAADIASAHDYTIQSSTAEDLRAQQIVTAILSLIEKDTK